LLLFIVIEIISKIVIYYEPVVLLFLINDLAGRRYVLYDLFFLLVLTVRMGSPLVVVVLLPGIVFIIVIVFLFFLFSGLGCLVLR